MEQDIKTTPWMTQPDMRRKMWLCARADPPKIHSGLYRKCGGKKKERKNAAIPACKLRPSQPECATFHTVAAAVLEKTNNWERGRSNDGGDWQLVICGRSFSREGI